jgi:hypothetical protein
LTTTSPVAMQHLLFTDIWRQKHAVLLN